MTSFMNWFIENFTCNFVCVRVCVMILYDRQLFILGSGPTILTPKWNEAFASLSFSLINLSLYLCNGKLWKKKIYRYFGHANAFDDKALLSINILLIFITWFFSLAASKSIKYWFDWTKEANRFFLSCLFVGYLFTSKCEQVHDSHRSNLSIHFITIAFWKSSFSTFPLPRLCVSDSLMPVRNGSGLTSGSTNLWSPTFFFFF